jgi:hypothetical protein
MCLDAEVTLNLIIASLLNQTCLTNDQYSFAFSLCMINIALHAPSHSVDATATTHSAAAEGDVGQCTLQIT